MSSLATRSYTGIERAAVLMMIVGEEEAAAILQKLEPEEVCQLGAAMFNVADVSEAEVAEVLDDFAGLASERTGISFDPRPQTEAVVLPTLGSANEVSALKLLDPSLDAASGIS